MSVGAIFSNRCLTGSCGGLAGMKDEHGRGLCESCTNPATECQAETSPDSPSNSAKESKPA
jgi:hypothetical protein